MNATITQGPSSAFGEVKNGTPRAISKACKNIAKAKIATPMNTNPTNERSRRLRPRHPIHRTRERSPDVSGCGTLHNQSRRRRGYPSRPNGNASLIKSKPRYTAIAMRLTFQTLQTQSRSPGFRVETCVLVVYAQAQWTGRESRRSTQPI